MGDLDPSRALVGDRYRLERVIGAGGTATVFQARDEFLGRDVAVKIFRVSASAEKDFRRQEEEVNVLAALSHPALVTLLDAALDRSDPDNLRIYFVMEIVEGVDLRRRLKSGTLPTRQVAQIGHDIADGLGYVHERDIVHRDIKPANILLSEATFDAARGRVRAKLTDFGIALRGDSGELEEDGSVTGTVAYFSPEQARGLPLGPESDVYSLGLVLLECFTGELAFPGSALESSAARLACDPQIPAELPEFWRELLRAMTDRDPANRPYVHDIAIALGQAVAEISGRHKLVKAETLTLAAPEPEDAVSPQPVNFTSSFEPAPVANTGSLDAAAS